jgi:hypothetical protein
MKRSKLTISLGIMFLSFALPAASQITLPEVKIVATTYKYLNAVDNEELAQPVRMLELRAATYDVKKANFYEDVYDTYFVSFHIPDGTILATYDKNGKLLRTAEKYKNIKLPEIIRTAVASRFPNWTISEDNYLVNYYDEGKTKKRYKLLLENGDQRLKVETNDKGEFN